MSTPDQDILLTVAEVAERLKLNQQTVRNWIDAGTLPAVRLGTRRVRVRASDLDAVIAPNVSRADEAADTSRQALKDALSAASEVDTDAELALALRELARTANALARRLER